MDSVESVAGRARDRATSKSCDRINLTCLSGDCEECGSCLIIDSKHSKRSPITWDRTSLDVSQGCLFKNWAVTEVVAPLKMPFKVKSVHKCMGSIIRSKGRRVSLAAYNDQLLDGIVYEAANFLLAIPSANINWPIEIWTLLCQS